MERIQRQIRKIFETMALATCCKSDFNATMISVIMAPENERRRDGRLQPSWPDVPGAWPPPLRQEHFARGPALPAVLLHPRSHCQCRNPPPNSVPRGFAAKKETLQGKKIEFRIALINGHVSLEQLSSGVPGKMCCHTSYASTKLAFPFSFCSVHFKLHPFS